MWLAQEPFWLDNLLDNLGVIKKKKKKNGKVVKFDSDFGEFFQWLALNAKKMDVSVIAHLLCQTT